MISIPECVPDLKQICKTHVDFVAKRVTSVIDFYVDVLSLIMTPKHHHEIAKMVMESKRKHGVSDYKTLLKPLLAPNVRIENEQQIHYLKFPERRSQRLKHIERCIEELELIKPEVV